MFTHGVRRILFPFDEKIKNIVWELREIISFILKINIKYNQIFSLINFRYDFYLIQVDSVGIKERGRGKIAFFPEFWT